MLNKKISIVIIVCVGAIISITLVTRTPKEIPETEQNVAGIVVERDNLPITVSDDWKKLLLETDAKNDVIDKSALKSNDAGDDTTLTAQLSKDFFAQYLVIANKGAVSDEDVNTIVENVLSLPQYTKTIGVVYTEKNLNVVQKTDVGTIQKYYDDMVSITKKLPKSNDDPMAIINTAVHSKKEADLAKLAPMVVAAKNTITDLLQVQVPKDAITLHLALLNDTSNVLANLEAMQNLFSDPVRSFVGMSQYSTHLASFLKNISSMGTYFGQRLFNR